jgi:hypothetical protein
VDEHENAEEGDTELDRKARLRQERKGSLVYDSEQQVLRSSLLDKLNRGNEEHGNDSDDTSGSSNDGLRLKQRAAPVRAEVCFI